MRVVVTSDWHLDAATHGVRRFDEVTTAAMQTVDYAIAKRADAYLFLGDAMDPDSGPEVFRCAEVMLRVAARLHAANIPSVFLAGNHDVVGDGIGTTTLTPLRALAQALDGVYVVEAPCVFRPRGLFTLCCLPFVEPALGYDPGKVVPDDCSDVVVVGHLNVPGVCPGSESTDFARGREVMFPVERTTRARWRANGHYHRAQNFDPGDGGKPIVIPGSLCRLTFGEEDHVPSFLDVEV